MLTVHTVADYMNLQPVQQQAIQKAIKGKDRLLNWIRKRNSRLPVHLVTNEPDWYRCPDCTEHPGQCHCWKDPQRYGWLHDKPRDNSGVHPSSVTYCLKMHWFSCMGYADQMQKVVEPGLQMIFDMGTGWHWVMQNFYGLRGAWGNPNDYHPETAISPERQPLAKQYRILGHADALLENYIVEAEGIGEVSVRLVHEYKTINSNQYTKLAKPKTEHRWQATIYSAVLDAPFADYLYVNKDNSQMAEFVIPFDRRLWEHEIVRKLEAISLYVDSKETPPWEHTSAILNPSECRGCGYVQLCNPQFR